MEKKSFEKTMGRLEEIVKELESGNKTVDEMLNLYEEGMKLYEECSKCLDGYEGKLSQISISKE